jgi:3-oxoacyl-[acyl-carrier protein] reductase
MKKLEGKVAIITGGGSGLGREMALALAEEGAAVVVSSYVSEQDEQVAAECRSVGGRAIAISADVSEQEEVDAMVTGAIAEFGRVDVLIAGAGIAGSADSSGVLDLSKKTHELTREQWDRMLSVNLTGVFLAVRAVVPHMIEQGDGGSIASISSASVRFAALPAPGAYVVSKIGLEGMTKRMARELDEHDIRVNTIQPGGMTYTPIIGATYGQGRAEHQHEPSVMRALAVYVASDDSRMVSGRSLVADEFNRSRGLTLCPCTRCNTRPNPLETEWHGLLAL